MKEEHFSWDDKKKRINERKHGISFEEAATVFSDTNAIYYLDNDHSGAEERFWVIGESRKERLLFVCHCYWENGTIIRIISARKANIYERGLYGGVR
jgi:uncharacterized DUF497 family protein